MRGKAGFVGGRLLVGGLRRGLGKPMFSTMASGLAVSAGVFAASNALGFTITAATRTHKVADLLSSGPFVLSAVATYAAGPGTTAGLVATGLTGLYCIRLTSFLVKRVLKLGKDTRFDGYIPEEGEKMTAAKLKSLGGLWTIMASWGFIVSLPVTIINSTAAATAGPLFWVFISGQAAGFVIEALADTQKSKFKEDPKNKGNFITTGLWKYSRHPNYFGEIVFWWSAFGSAVASCGISAPALLAIGSPAMTTALLLKVSGIPLAEQKDEEKYGVREEFQRYKRTTNLLIPGTPKRED
ncbi:hypothetical protein NDN08_002714 [Rhodosorus marinus]|uniref:Steroid 5-alpha reductase C-terminal domain-containing protein n=1 Tax=Rhodosorus marinus TaxID=101924 RepID=A0AAV8UUJ2_9RHOD|nr:hypothetical protein NDN08_002714 [Rhodosorus marinus]